MSITERSAEIFAATASIFLSGTICSISIITVPTLLSTYTTDDVLLQQWKKIYDRGSNVGPLIAIHAALVHGGLAYLKWKRGENPTSSILAVLFTIGIAPFTGVAMQPTNTRLMHGASSAEKEKQEDARALIDKWMWLNGVRGLLPMIGGVLSLVGIII